MKFDKLPSVDDTILLESEEHKKFRIPKLIQHHLSHLSDAFMNENCLLRTAKAMLFLCRHDVNLLKIVGKFAWWTNLYYTRQVQQILIQKGSG